MSALACHGPAASPRLPRPLVVAIGASVGLHLLALAWQHGPRLATDTPPLPLHVVLRTAAPLPEPAPPAAADVARPRPAPAQLAVASPRPAAPSPVTRAKPVETPPSTPVLTRRLPGTSAVRVESAPLAPVAAPTVTTAAAPTPAAAPPAPAADPAPAHSGTLARAEPAADEALDPALLERYGRSLSSLLARQQNYPRMAAMRGWEGEVQLRITIARKGNVVATQVIRSSGFDVLDQNAIQLVTAAGPLPRPPDALQNREIQVIVPVHYKLEKPA